MAVDPATLQTTLEDLALNPASVTGDAGSFTERSADDVRKLLALAAEGNLTGTNPQGGPKSPWRSTRMARVIPPGAA